MVSDGVVPLRRGRARVRHLGVGDRGGRRCGGDRADRSRRGCLTQRRGSRADRCWRGKLRRDGVRTHAEPLPRPGTRAADTARVRERRAGPDFGPHRLRPLAPHGTSTARPTARSISTARAGLAGLRRLALTIGMTFQVSDRPTRRVGNIFTTQPPDESSLREICRHLWEEVLRAHSGNPPNAKMRFEGDGHGSVATVHKTQGKGRDR
jgi:hypothetical protein